MKAALYVRVSTTDQNCALQLGDLERFIGLPHHVGIMERYGPRGKVRSTRWHADTFDRQAVVEQARHWIREAA